METNPSDGLIKMSLESLYGQYKMSVLFTVSTYTSQYKILLITSTLWVISDEGTFFSSLCIIQGLVGISENLIPGIG